MKMSNNKVKGYIQELFVEIKEDISDIIKFAPTIEMATQSIMECVARKITMATQGYMVDLYSELSKKTLQEAIFQDPANANRFYEIDIRQQIMDAYQFEVQDLKSYSTGMDFKEIDRTYATAVSAVGSATVGGLLLGALSNVVHIPFAVILAGAFLTGIGCGGTVYYIVPEKNKEKYQCAVESFLCKLEKELLCWVDEVIDFYNKKVDELKQTL